MAVEIKTWEPTKDGKETHLYYLRNNNGMEAIISDFGACLISLIVPDNLCKKTDVVLGFESLSSYENNVHGLGATIGRCANRIGGGRFTLNGKTYQLKQNDGSNNLHSGGESYHLRMWEATVKEGEKEDSVKLFLFSPDGDQGFPGNLKVSVTYTLNDDNQLIITYNAIADADTIINVTNHSYFNLEGHDSGDILNHYVWIDADYITETDAQLIPTGTLLPLNNGAMDFTEEKKIGLDIDKEEEPLLIAGGYDHNYVLNRQGSYRKIASLKSENNGLLMEIFTDLPGVQFYTGNFLKGTTGGKNGAVYEKRSGVCFETQYYPDAPNHSNFPEIRLGSNDRYHTITAYCFNLNK